MSISKFIGSLFSFTNENSAALASARFDFTLVKIDAPAEYSALGPALTSYRRRTAEEGEIHRTARRLGALFEQLIPSTPHLVKAYGLRCTEIIGTPGVNPKGSPSRHGPFESFVGADGTALWAAATSGISSLAVYLLACLLADSWGQKEAISIWVELVERRKKEIMDQSSSCGMVTESSVASTLQEISRSDLALWDASARAWVQSANDAKFRERKQLGLILENIDIPFNNGSDPYRKVIEIWIEAMKGMENLLCGQPQLANTKSTLQAFSTWQIYPDLIVLGKDVVKVAFKDHLIPSNGVCTIGTWTSPTHDSEEMLWSLTLSHLRYYGEPVKVQSEGNKNRVKFPQLYLVIMGGLLGSWGVPLTDIYRASEWLSSLWKRLENSTVDSHSHHLEAFQWLRSISSAADLLIASQSSSSNDSECLQVVKYGHRRAKSFILPKAEKSSPFFGLLNPCVSRALRETHHKECIIRYYREIATRLESHPVNLIINSGWNELHNNTKYCFTEYATATPYHFVSPKRDNDGNHISNYQHARWLCCGGDVNETPPIFNAWKRDVTKQGELAFNISDLKFKESYNFESNPRYLPNLVVIDPPWLFQDFSMPECSSREDLSQRRFKMRRQEYYCVFQRYRSTLYAANPVGTDVKEFREDLQNSIREIESEISFYSLDIQAISPTILYDYLFFVTNVRAKLHGIGIGEGLGNDSLPKTDWEDEVTTAATNIESPVIQTAVLDIAQQHRLPSDTTISLCALNLASTVYQSLEDATVSLSVVERPLFSSQWVSDIKSSLLSTHRDMNIRLSSPGDPMCKPEPTASISQSTAFACIAFFESGDMDLSSEDLKQVFAVSMGNSIFVSGRVLSDPYDCTPDHLVSQIRGNIGRSGTCLLVTPSELEIRRPSNEYDAVTHAIYDQRRENNFKGTSLHLRFTDWKAPLVDPGADARTIDHGVSYVESVLSVRDAGRWVADLNILKIPFHQLARFAPEEAEHHHLSLDREHKEFTSIDNWNEFLDMPDTVTVFRARGNWAARLAAVSIMCQLGQADCISLCGPQNYCLECLEVEEDIHLRRKNSHRRNRHDPAEHSHSPRQYTVRID